MKKNQKLSKRLIITSLLTIFIISAFIGTVFLTINNLSCSTQIEFDSSKIYSIINCNSQKALDVKDASLESGAAIQQWEYDNTNWKHWKIRKTSDGNYTISSNNSHLTLGIKNKYYYRSQKVIQTEDNQSNYQKWKLESIDNNTFKIISCANNRVLSIPNSSTQNGIEVKLLKYSNIDSQKWIISEVGSKSTSIIPTKIVTTNPPKTSIKTTQITTATNNNPTPSSTKPVDKTGLNVPDNWKLIINENFDGSGLNKNIWRPGLPYDGVDHLNDELEHYNEKNVLINNGLCTLQATKDSNGTIYSGCITSNIGYKYGHTEARIKLPKGKGFWPAYWLTSSDGRWPPEWDIFEVVNTKNEIYGYTHPVKGGKCNFIDGKAGSDCIYTLSEGAPNIYDDFVVYGLTWTEKDVYWFVNGIQTEHFSVDSTSGSNDHFWIMLNLAVGGQWPGNPDNTTPWPGNMQIDYIKLWQP